MVAKKRGLGRGLDALLSDVTGSHGYSDPNGHVNNDPQGDNLRELAVNVIEPGRYQPRRDLNPEALEDLASSIRSQGVMQPIVVRPVAGDRYEIIAGERRWRASQMAGLDRIPVIIRDVPDEAAIAMALIENIQRENLNPIEEAIALQRLQNEFELTQQQVADAVGKSRSTIANLLRLMNLTPEVRTLLEHGDLEMGHARALLALQGLVQIRAADEVVAKELSVRQTEELVKRYQGQSETPAKPKSTPDPELEQLASSLSQRLSTGVSIRSTSNGKGKISIDFKTREELDAILQLIS
ncbi:ParB/RepB/Spo0J family partition protein [Marinobacterium sediminicola]|uniref:Probable chromosome-partitioning protein ParB n=1 Tax=Marinobacterium sediminicola TaxID=518898 RepID=A0ABY1S4C3_9GAMM|nr:ParB/RepB/Spo0J family partition protein [Marinobacterium sediminicola]ULG69224.1 ParB/RepB/Spo0J family partition protein [Marinobacterium sediminicola]SMR78315.1 chromosome partitioning protein, ParB family [Marinobacterium sediminicola]